MLTQRDRRGVTDCGDGHLIQQRISTLIALVLLGKKYLAVTPL